MTITKRNPANPHISKAAVLWLVEKYFGHFYFMFF